LVLKTCRSNRYAEARLCDLGSQKRRKDGGRADRRKAPQAGCSTKPTSSVEAASNAKFDVYIEIVRLLQPAQQRQEQAYANRVNRVEPEESQGIYQHE
jgi:hypothetical protein